jgi:hypothetical protein
LNKGSIYITIANTFVGISASFLLNNSAVIAFVLSVLAVGTVLGIERKWLIEKIFRHNKWFEIGVYSFLAVILIVGLFLLTKPDREMSQILKTVHVYLNDIKAHDYRGAYGQLSSASKKNYPLDHFIRYHSNKGIKIQDFTIDKIMFNKYDDRKAEVVITSPFLLYGREKLDLEMIKEGNKWCVVVSRTTISDKTPADANIGNSKKSGGFFSRLFGG